MPEHEVAALACRTLIKMISTASNLKHSEKSYAIIVQIV